MLTVEDLEAGYGDRPVVSGVNLHVPAGRVVGLVGPNGAGRSTVLGAIAGVVSVRRGRVELDGRDVTHEPPHVRARAGLCYLPERGGFFRSLTVADNLALFADGVPRSADPLVLIPELASREDQVAGTLSGGEQQLLALARAVSSRASTVVVDEPSLGLAPRAWARTFAALRAIADGGAAVLVVEQRVDRIAGIADDVLTLVGGRLVEASGDERQRFTRYLAR